MAKKRKKKVKVKKKETFDKDKELGYVFKWVLIALGIGGFFWQIIGTKIEYAIFLSIISLLLVIIYMQNKKIKHLEK